MSLPVEHIKVGNFIWYEGSTSMWTWDCPAQIVEVDEASKTFKVMSLDDMETQRQRYDFEVGAHSPTSRQSMRAITPTKAASYLLKTQGFVLDRIEDTKGEIVLLNQQIQRDETRAKKMAELVATVTGGNS